MLPMSIAMLALGIHALRPEFELSQLAGAVAEGALVGLVVAVVEETFFRGLMYRAIERESGFAAAAACTALVYASIHFFARVKIPAEDVAWDSGFRLLGGALANLSHPLAIIDSFVTLTLVGLLLAWCAGGPARSPPASGCTWAGCGSSSRRSRSAAKSSPPPTRTS